MHHLMAMIELLIDVPSPKAAGVRSKYSPHHSFSNVDWVASGVHSYEDDEMHYPGEKLIARISFASWEWLQDKVKVGDPFEVLEVERLIGRGVVVSIP